MLWILFCRSTKDKITFKKGQERPRIRREDIQVMMQEPELKSFPSVAMKTKYGNGNKSSYHSNPKTVGYYANKTNKNNEPPNNANYPNHSKKPIKLPAHAVNHKMTYGVNKPNDVFFESGSKWQAGKLARQAHNLSVATNVTTSNDPNDGSGLNNSGSYINGVLKNKIAVKIPTRSINGYVINSKDKVKPRVINVADEKGSSDRGYKEMDDFKTRIQNANKLHNINYNNHNHNIGNTITTTYILNNTNNTNNNNNNNNNNSNNNNNNSNNNNNNSNNNNNNSNNNNNNSNSNSLKDNNSGIYSLSTNTFLNNTNKNNVNNNNNNNNINNRKADNSGANNLRVNNHKRQPSSDAISIGNSSKNDSESSYGFVEYDEKLKMPKIFNLKNTSLLEEIDNRLKYKREIMNNNNEGDDKSSGRVSNNTNVALNSIHNISDVYGNYGEDKSGDMINHNNDAYTSISTDNKEVIEGLANEDNYQRLPCDMVDNENTTNNCNPENTNNNIVNNCIADSSTQNKEDFEENIGLECVVRHSYKAQYDDDISIATGEVIYVNQMLANGWWRGIKGEEEGFFPGSYVRVKGEEKKEPEKHDDLTERTKSSLIELSEAIKVEGLSKTILDDNSLLRKKAHKTERFGHNTISKYFSKKFTNFTEAVKNGTISEAFARKRVDETKAESRKLERVKSSRIAKGRNRAPEAPTSRTSILFGNLFQRKSLDSNSKNTPTLEMSLVDCFDGLLDSEKNKASEQKAFTLPITSETQFNDDVYTNLDQYNSLEAPSKPKRSSFEPDFHGNYESSKTDTWKPKVPPKTSRMTTSLTNLNQVGLSISNSSDGRWSPQLDINKPNHKPPPPSRPSNALKPKNWKNSNVNEVKDRSNHIDKPTRKNKPPQSLEVMKEFSVTKPDIKCDMWALTKENDKAPIFQNNSLSFEDELKLRLNRKNI